jgi:hypothetical protein
MLATIQSRTFYLRLLSKNIKIRIYKTIILPVILYGCETWSLTLTLQGGHLKITAVGPLAVVFFNYPFKFCSKLYYA